MRELLICLIIFAGAVAGFYAFYPETGSRSVENNVPVDPIGKKPKEKASEKSGSVFEKNKAKRDVTPDAVLPAPKILTEKLERLPAAEPPPQPKRKEKPKPVGRTEVLSAGVLRSDKKVIELAGIKPLSLKAKCEDENAKVWPCGMLARTELRQFVRGRPVACHDRGAKNAKKVVTRCELSNFDISAWLVLTGWALPEGDLFKDELKEAKAKQRGQWRKFAP